MVEESEMKDTILLRFLARLKRPPIIKAKDENKIKTSCLLFLC
ncbi:hypothetical protein THF1C08_30287 [Vibrio jasicida]|nr:hypothetical protein THF1C08_30287 [Vibrio jasicida]